MTECDTCKIELVCNGFCTIIINPISSTLPTKSYKMCLHCAHEAITQIDPEYIEAMKNDGYGLKRYEWLCNSNLPKVDIKKWFKEWSSRYEKCKNCRHYKFNHDETGKCNACQRKQDEVILMSTPKSDKGFFIDIYNNAEDVEK